MHPMDELTPSTSSGKPVPGGYRTMPQIVALAPNLERRRHGAPACTELTSVGLDK